MLREMLLLRLRLDALYDSIVWMLAECETDEERERALNEAQEKTIGLRDEISAFSEYLGKLRANSYILTKRA